VSVFRCHVVESVFSQYCGHSSAAGVTRYIRFREPLIVEPEVCRSAKQTYGNITIAGRVFRGNVGTTTSHWTADTIACAIHFTSATAPSTNISQLKQLLS
jgi:hypothetical protein